MKQKLLAGCSALVLALGPAALGQPSLVWDNWGQIIVGSEAYPYAPQIDALTFYNHAGATFNVYGSGLYTTSDTLNYTNEGSIYANPGFDFQTYPPDMGVPTMAANFVNRVSGQSAGLISVNGALLLPTGLGGTLFFGNLGGNAKIVVRATNIINSATIDMSAASLLKMEGKNIDLSHGDLQMANPLSTTFNGTNIIFNGINILFNSGVLDYYWAAETATNSFNPFLDFSGNFAFTPTHWVTNRNYLMLMTSLYGMTPYVFDWGAVNSNRLVQAVFLSNLNPSFVNSVYFTRAHIAVQWRWTTPAWPNRGVNTNYFYFTDNFGEVTNIGVRVNGYINPQALYPTPTYRPINYQLFYGQPYNANVPAATPGLPPNTFTNADFTNQYASYEGFFSAGTALPTDIAGGAYSNMPGRIEITAEDSLDLTKARISTVNYLRLDSTNHFRGSQNATITTPYADYNLGSTNGSLTISNIISPIVDHPSGPCALYSARWTNVVNSITNCYHVLFVESYLAPYTTPLVDNLWLSSTNRSGGPGSIVINDALNVSTSMRLAAQSVTIGQNDSSAFSSAGALNITNPAVIWPTATPGLEYLTNWGAMTMQNAVYFGGSRTEPPYNGAPDVPYHAMVNHGTIYNDGSLIWADYFENDGSIQALQGSIVLQNCSYANLSGGLLGAPYGQISLAASTLVTTNSFLQTGGSLDLALTNSVSDGGPGFLLFPANRWSAEAGFNLYNKPAEGDLLGTTVSNSAPAYSQTLNYWAGEDRGNSVDGFTNNCAIGRLLLYGGTGSSFRFIGTGTSNALYVDYLQLSGSATNRDAYGNFSGLSIDPNMKIYFAEAVAGGRSIAEKLDGKNGGRLVWVYSYAGAYSSTNLLYPDGNRYTFNRPLVQSCNRDDDNDGIANCSDSTPIWVPGMIKLSIGITNQPAGAKVIRWQTLGGSTNTLFYNTVSSSSNWQVLTNFVFGPNNGTATMLDTSTNSTRYYRLRVDPRAR